MHARGVHYRAVCLIVDTQWTNLARRRAIENQTQKPVNLGSWR
jgi:hypothetical protein